VQGYEVNPRVFGQERNYGDWKVEEDIEVRGMLEYWKTWRWKYGHPSSSDSENGEEDIRRRKRQRGGCSCRSTLKTSTIEL